VNCCLTTGETILLELVTGNLTCKPLILFPFGQQRGYFAARSLPLFLDVFFRKLEPELFANNAGRMDKVINQAQ
jgi:hypothetical protein